MTKWPLIVASLVLLPAAASCTGWGSSPSSAGTTPDGSSSTVETLPLTGTIVELNGGAAIAGARICVVGRFDIPCATSGTDGTYTLPIPVWTTAVDFALNATALGHLGFTWLLHETPDTASWPAVQKLYDDASAITLMFHAGLTYPLGGQGAVLVSVYRESAGEGAVGTTVSSSPAGEGPVYLDATGTPDPTLIALTSDGHALLANFEPGPVEITVADPSCIQTFPMVGGYFNMWADAKPATIAGVTAADSITEMDMICPPPP